ncbi:hypothetical protein P9112_013792 [Eukaryota sp. TZLM1-RC]
MVFGEHIIHHRRAQEDTRRSYIDYTTTQHKLCSVASFEERVHKHDQKRQLSQHYNSLLNEKRASLDSRRRRLAARYATDLESWLAGLKNLQEPPEARRQRIMTQARSLQQSRLAASKKEAEEKEQLRWEQSCDALRSAKSQLLAEETARLWALQIDEKKARESMDNEINGIFDSLALENDKKRVEEEKRKEKDRKDRDAKGKIELDRQMEIKVNQERELQLEKEAELKKLRDLWEKEEENTILLEEMKQKEAADLRFELNRINKLIQDEKNRKLLEEAKKDREILEHQIKQAELEDAKEHYKAQLKKQREQESFRNNQLLKQKIQEDEATIDRLCQEAADKEFARREARWRMEEEARRKLLEECDAFRRNEIKKRIEGYEKKREDERKEAAEINAMLRKAELMEREEEVKKRFEAIELAKFQKEQQLEKEKVCELEKEKKLKEEKEMLRKNAEEEQKIREYLAMSRSKR